MEKQSLPALLRGNPYPGRGILLGRSADGQSAVAAYFIMGRSENSRNRVFVETEDGIRTQAHDPAKMTDPSLIIYHPGAHRHQRRPDGHHPGLSSPGPHLPGGPPVPGVRAGRPQLHPPYLRPAVPGRQLPALYSKERRRGPGLLLPVLLPL